MTPTTSRWKLELLLGLCLLCAGLTILPLPVYWAGVALAGEYAGGQGLWGFLVDLWRDAAHGRASAWALFLAPYLMFQLVRLALALLRSPSTVTDITNSAKYQ